MNIRSIISFSVLLVSFLLFSLVINAQKVWKLSECINYALENNIDVSLKNNNVLTQQIYLSESKANLFPDLNMGSSAYVNFGRNIDGSTNDITYNRTLNNNYWVRSSVDIFRGLVKLNTIGFDNYLLLANREDALIAKNKLILNIITSYYTVLYSKGLLDVAQQQVKLTEKQIVRMQKFVDVGRKSDIVVQELKSQWANDKLSYTRAENLLNKTMLRLKQLLRLDVSQPFSIDTTSNNLITIVTNQNIDSLYNKAVSVLPEIKFKEYLYNASVKDLAVAKGFISPQVYLAAGYNTSFFDGSPLSYAKQLENNQNQWINLGVTIPIFNNAMVHSKIKRKKIAVNNRKLELIKQQEDLYSEIWKAVDDLKSAQKEYQASVELSHYSKLTLKNTSAKMEKGLASTTDYDLAKQRYMSAQANLLKTKLIFILKSQIIEFYNTGSWDYVYRK